MIYIGFSSPNKFKIAAELIKFWIKRPYSHVYIRFVSSDPEIPSSVYHAANGMVHFRTFENFKKDNNVISEYALPVSRELRKKILIFAMNLSAEPYDKLDLVKILVTDILHFFGIKLTTYSGVGYICSELVGKILIEFFGYKFNKPQHLLKPSDIEDSLKENKCLALEN